LKPLRKNSRGSRKGPVFRKGRGLNEDGEQYLRSTKYGYWRKKEKAEASFDPLQSQGERGKSKVATWAYGLKSLELWAYCIIEQKRGPN